MRRRPTGSASSPTPSWCEQRLVRARKRRFKPACRRACPLRRCRRRPGRKTADGVERHLPRRGVMVSIAVKSVWKQYVAHRRARAVVARRPRDAPPVRPLRAVSATAVEVQLERCCPRGAVALVPVHTAVMRAADDVPCSDPDRVQDLAAGDALTYRRTAPSMRTKPRAFRDAAAQRRASTATRRTSGETPAVGDALTNGTRRPRCRSSARAATR